MPRFRLRFSILNALLLMTIVAMAMVIVRLWREGDLWRAEVHQLRDEVGQLSIEEPTKVAAIRLLSLDESTWKYRIHVPQGQRLGLVLKVNEVPQNGLPAIWRPPSATHPGRWSSSMLPNGHYLFLGEGEHVVTVGIATNEEGNRCVGLEWHEIATGFRTNLKSIDVDALHWPRVDPGGFEEGVGRSTQVMDGEKEMVLVRHRVPVGSAPLGQLTDGFLLWLEPINADHEGKTSSGTNP